LHQHRVQQQLQQHMVLPNQDRIVCKSYMCFTRSRLRERCLCMCHLHMGLQFLYKEISLHLVRIFLQLSSHHPIPCSVEALTARVYLSQCTPWPMTCNLSRNTLIDMYVVWELNTLEGTSCVCNVLLSEQIRITNSGGLTLSQVYHQIQIFRLTNPSFLCVETVDNLRLPWSTLKINQQRLSDEQVPSFWCVFSLKSVCDIMKWYGGKRWSIQGRRHKPGIAKLCQPSNHTVLHKVWWSGSTSVDETPKHVSIAVCTHFVGTFLSICSWYSLAITHYHYELF
jgi:hypothetical protein